MSNGTVPIGTAVYYTGSEATLLCGADGRYSWEDLWVDLKRNHQNWSLFSEKESKQYIVFFSIVSNYLSIMRRANLTFLLFLLIINEFFFDQYNISSLSSLFQNFSVTVIFWKVSPNFLKLMTQLGYNANTPYTVCLAVFQVPVPWVFHFSWWIPKKWCIFHNFWLNSSIIQSVFAQTHVFLNSSAVFTRKHPFFTKNR